MHVLSNLFLFYNIMAWLTNVVILVLVAFVFLYFVGLLALYEPPYLFLFVYLIYSFYVFNIFSPAMYVNQIFGMMFSFAFITRNKQMKQMRNAHTTNKNNTNVKYWIQNENLSIYHVIKIRPFISLFGLSIEIFTSDNRSTSSDAKGQILIRLWKLQKKSNKNGIIYKMQIDDHTMPLHVRIRISTVY